MEKKDQTLRSKKGVLGLDTATAFVIALLVLIVIAVVFIITLGSFSSLGTSPGLADTGHNDNETVVLNDTGLPLTVSDLRDISTSNEVVTNASGGEIIEDGNYTISAAIITTVTSTYNNTNVNVSYDFSSANADFISIIGNTTSGVESLFASTTTWFTLLAVVIIILIIVIVIVAVKGIGGVGFLSNRGNIV